MNGYVNWFDRMAWDLICAKISAKQRLNTTYGFLFQSRGYGKTLTTRALYRSIAREFSPYFRQISVRWCESFEILDDRKRRVCFVHMAKI